MRFLSRAILVLTFLVCTLSQPLFSASYNCYTPLGGESGIGALSLTPYAEVGASPFFGYSLAGINVSYGITANIDAILGIGYFNLSPSFNVEEMSFMPRFDLGGNNILALMLKYSATKLFVISPQYHTMFTFDLVCLEINLKADIPVTNAKSSMIKAQMAPVVSILDGLIQLSVEIDAAYTLGTGGGFNLDIIPGIAWNINDKNQLFVGVPLYYVNSSLSPSIGIWYWLGI